MTERSLATERLQFLAHHDPLTQVLNRDGIRAELDWALQSAQTGPALVLAYLDLDRFKLINDLPATTPATRCCARPATG